MVIFILKIIERQFDFFILSLSKGGGYLL